MFVNVIERLVTKWAKGILVCVFFLFTLPTEEFEISESKFFIRIFNQFKNTTLKKMKKIVLALIVALMGTIVMSAQPPRRPDMNPEQMVEKRVERLDKALSLTAEQKAEVTRIYSEEFKAMGKEKPAMRERGEKPDEATMKARHEKMKAERDAVNAKIEALLTPEQAAKFAQMKQHKGKRGSDRHHKGPKDGKNGNQRGCCCQES